MTLDEIIDDYIRRYRSLAWASMHLFEIQRCPLHAIRKAAFCMLPSGKRHPHQRRIPKATLEHAEARLQSIALRLAKARDFAALFRLVKDEIGGIHGIGDLTVYDIAHRLGAYFRRPPQLVYLHAGTRTGARAFNIRGDSVAPKSLPAAFARLTPAEIEDCLCIYKDELRERPRPRVARRRRCISL